MALFLKRVIYISRGEELRSTWLWAGYGPDSAYDPIATEHRCLSCSCM